MGMVLRDVAKKLGLGEYEVEVRAACALVLEELRKVRVEKAQILIKYAKYDVKGFKDLFRLVEEDILCDTEVHEDLTRLDYLEYREKELEKTLRELENKLGG